MRMAKALIAAVSLAVVLVAAVVVPLVFLPGVFGFNDWPEATPTAPREHVVTLDVPARKTVVVERKRRVPAAPKPAPVASHQRLAQATPAPAPVAAPVASHSQPQQPPRPTAPAAPAEPQAAPEAQPEPVAIDARDDAGPAERLLDGTNLP
jgi:hypothetical protein